MKKLKDLSKEQKEKFIKDLSIDEAMLLFYDWKGVFARESQIEPSGDWTYWLILAGRGWG